MSEHVKEVVEQADELGAPNLGAAIEALLLLTDEPMPAIELAQITRAPLPDVERVLHELSVEYTEQMRGLSLLHI